MNVDVAMILLFYLAGDCRCKLAVAKSGVKHLFFCKINVLAHSPCQINTCHQSVLASLAGRVPSQSLGTFRDKRRHHSERTILLS